MTLPFAPLPSLRLRPNTSFGADTQPLEMVRLESPAMMVMTDFRSVHPVTTYPEIGIDDALNKMKTAGVRLLFVLNAADEIVGLVTAKDIMGEKPIKITQQARVPRAQIRVSAVMTAQPDIQVLEMMRVRIAQVGDIVETLRAAGRQHALVVEADNATGAQRVVGMFSTSYISKLLGRDVTGDVPPARSLAEIVEKIA